MDAALIQVLDSAFHPKAIAVVGASENPFSFGYHYVRHLLDYGYPGHIYPVNPSKVSILGMKAYPNLSSIPDSVDYVICCLPAFKVIDLLAECPSRGVKVIHLPVTGLSEISCQEGKDLEAKILCEARRFDVRLIGPNCMGIYYPGGGIAHGYDLPKEAGTISAMFQGRGLSHILVRYGESRGLRFNKVISYGNAIDLDESDFLQYLAQDNETTVVAAYIEGVKDGTRFLRVLSNTARAKPVLVIKSGHGISGSNAVSSYTTTLAGSDVIWKTAFKKSGVIPVKDLTELVDLLVAFSFLPPVTGNRVGIASGGGGGSAVLAADMCEEAGLVVPPLPREIREQLKAKAPEMWDCIENPLDVSVAGVKSTNKFQFAREALEMMAGSTYFDLILVEITDGNPLPMEAFNAMVVTQTEAIIDISRRKLKPVVVVVGGDVDLGQYRDRRWQVLAHQVPRLVNAHVPTYSTTANAARAIRRIIGYWQEKLETTR